MQIAETVALTTSHGSVQHMAKDVTNVGNEVILPLYAEALLLLPKARQINDVTTGTTSQSDPSVYEYISLVGGKKRNYVGSKMRSTLLVNGTYTCTFKLDAGAKANILPFDLYKQVCSSLPRSTSTVLCGLDNAVIKPLSSINVVVCEREDRDFPLLFYVTDIIDLPILGKHACDLLNLVKKVDTIANLEI